MWDRDLYAVGSDGSGLTRLTESSEQRIRDVDSTWSPDGSRLAFTSSNRERSDTRAETAVYTMNSDGTCEGRGTGFGTAYDDRLCGRCGVDRLFGLAGADRVEGGAGADVVAGGFDREVLLGGAGPDRILARDGERDRVDCGAGHDRVVADRRNRIARNCERVVRR